MSENTPTVVAYPTIGGPILLANNAERGPRSLLGLPASTSRDPNAPTATSRLRRATALALSRAILP
jgi:hypothetical protein